MENSDTTCKPICADVTFILPVYNGANYIAETINSILSQSYQNWILLILDNCSTDDTQAICSNFLNDARISYIKNEYNIGLIGNLSKGINMTQTIYWCYVCHDDKFTNPSAISQAHTLLESDPTLAMVTSPLAWIDNKSKQIADFAEPVHGKLFADDVNKLMIKRMRITYGLIMLARTELVKTFDPIVETTAIADVELFIHISQGRNVYIYDKSHYAIRFHPSNNSMRSYKDSQRWFNLIANKYNIVLTPFEQAIQTFNSYKLALGKRIFFLYLDWFRK